tara:strand:- start:1425 stop:2165 length:741 start_codon:yes stop_codon:yes gene_type:complete
MDDFKPSKDCLKDKTILITGSGSGIGRAAAKTLSQLGAQLILLSKDTQKLENLYKEIVDQGAKEPLIHSMNFEGAEEEQYLLIKEAIKNKFDKLDGLINNAGILGEKKPLEQYQYSIWKKVLNVNLDSTFLLTKTLLPLLNHSKLSSVVFTSSGVGRKGRAYWGAYAISKFAIEGMMEVFADELENTSKIRVNCINPGAVRTKMREEAYPAEDPEINPLPKEIMDLYVYLMCDISKDISGQSINAQ